MFTFFRKHNYYFIYVIIFSFFLINIAPILFSDGMFLDGVLYASISRNMANGLGMFWYPHLTDTLAPEFHGHPPLGLFLQSLFFEVFGDSFLVERFYSLGTFCLIVIILIFIWKEITGSVKFGWIPFFLLIAIPSVTWCYANNTLENTMSIFVSLSVLFYLKSTKSTKNNRYLLTLCGLSLAAAFLVKGFTGIYPLSLPIWYGLFYFKKNGFKDVIIQTSIIFLGMTLPFLILFTFSESASDSLYKYLMEQVFGSIKNIQTVNSRFSIFLFFFDAIKRVLILLLIIVLIGRIMKVSFSSVKENLIKVYPLLFLTFSGILPIMISLKQHTIYILTVYPFFVIVIGYTILPVVKRIMNSVENKPWLIYIAKILAIILFIFSIWTSIDHTDEIDWHKDKVEAVYSILEIVPKNTTIGICDELKTDWRLHAYFARYGNVSLETDCKNDCNFYVTEKDKCSKNTSHNSSGLNLKSTYNRYTLYQKKD